MAVIGRHARTIEEAGHAVVARKLAIAVKRVSIRANEAHALTESASYLARNLDIPAQMKASDLGNAPEILEIVAASILAGAANLLLRADEVIEAVRP